MFSGYNKHLAHYLAIHPGLKEKFILNFSSIIKRMPQSRNGKFSNLSRQANKYIDGYNLSAKDRYWKWASIADTLYTQNLLLKPKDSEIYKSRRNSYIDLIEDENNINDLLFTDMHLVLQNDMLTKVDLMSMANSLEVRTPFLDHNIVNFVFSLPEHFKIDSSIKKKILQDTFRNILPQELYKRPKHGFEVPLLKWFRNELNDDLKSSIFDRNFIESQGIFNWNALQELEKQLFSYSPADAAAKVWALFVFQHWWKKYFD
jgi:asparagine synthase (glutamine-hydrolysing)